ncbi:MAG: hypothetical protein ABI354_03150 [Candidatus Saccharimonadales bacterium]
MSLLNNEVYKSFVPVVLVGNPSSGKTELARHMVKTRGFYAISGSAILKSVASERGVRLSKREDFDSFHKLIRSEYGLGFMAGIVLGAHCDRPMFDGLRNISDYDRFRQAGANIIALWSPIENRYQNDCHRAIENGEIPSTYEQFRQAEAPEYDSPDPNGLHVMRIMQLADYHIDASQPLEAVVTQVTALIDSFRD